MLHKYQITSDHADDTQAIWNVYGSIEPFVPATYLDPAEGGFFDVDRVELVEATYWVEEADDFVTLPAAELPMLLIQQLEEWRDSEWFGVIQELATEQAELDAELAEEAAAEARYEAKHDYF